MFKLAKTGKPRILPVKQSKKKTEAVEKCKHCAKYSDPGWCLEHRSWCYIARTECLYQQNKYSSLKLPVFEGLSVGAVC